MERRDWLKLAMATAAAAGARLPVSQAATAVAVSPDGVRPLPQLRWTIFTRHLQWLCTAAESRAQPYETGVKLGEAAQRIGFRHLDLTVRRTGLVDPDQVALDAALPAMLKGIRAAGAECDQITTNIELADRPIGLFGGKPIVPEALLRVASDHGIRLYRWGGFAYAGSAFGEQLAAQLDALAAQLAPLAALNRRLGITALYHTYSGGNHARSVWDLMRVLQPYPGDELAINFDIGHMVREGALSAWSSNLRYAMPRIRGIGLKDGMVSRAADGTIGASFPRAGSGLVQWPEFFRLLLQGGYRGPAEVQCEYDVIGLKGANVSLNNSFWSDHAEFQSGNLTAGFMIDELRRELAYYRSQAALAGWHASQLA